MGLFIHTDSHSQSGSKGMVFLLGALFNTVVNLDFSGVLDDTLKALIGGFVWLLYKLIADYIASRSKAKQQSTKDESEKQE